MNKTELVERGLLMLLQCADLKYIRIVDFTDRHEVWRKETKKNTSELTIGVSLGRTANHTPKAAPARCGVRRLTVRRRGVARLAVGVLLVSEEAMTVALLTEKECPAHLHWCWGAKREAGQMDMQGWMLRRFRHGRTKRRRVCRWKFGKPGCTNISRNRDRAWRGLRKRTW